jgi:hypothetical protein
MTTHAPRAALLVCLAAAAGAAAAQAPVETRFELRPSGAGPQRLDAPPAFLSASARGDLGDLRLRDAAGAEIPYLLVAPAEAAPRWIGVVRARAIKQSKTASGAEIDLGSVREVSALEVEFRGPGYLKRASLEGSADGRRWTTLVDETVLYQLPLDPAACGGDTCPGALVRREIPFAPAAVRWLRLVLDDRRSPSIGTPLRARARLADPGAPAAGPLVPLAVTRLGAEPRTSRFALRLPGPHLPVRAIVLEVDAEHLARPARVLEARLARERLVPVDLGRATLLQVAKGDLVASELRIPVAAPEETELELVVDDGDNAPLALRAARAELAPLPWILFESKDGAPVEARLGDPARAAPRYDLEALRPAVAKLRTARATATALGAAPAEATAPGSAIPDAARAGAALDRKAFRAARAVDAAEPGLSALRLDAEVLARSPALGDLRLAGGDGRQIPYLLERRDEPLAVPLQVGALPAGTPPPREIAGPGLTIHELRAPQPLLPEGELVLETGARVFTRKVQVWAKPAHLRDGEGELVADGVWAHADPDRPAPALTLHLPRLAGARILVAVKDGDNAPLPLTAGRLLLEGYRLRFFHPGGSLELLYGADLGAPQYDLALLAPRLRAAPAREVKLGAPAGGGEAAGDAAPDGRAARIAFWVVLGLAVLGLLAMMARLLRHGGGEPPPQG